ncbi:MAG: hypothetical protein ACRECD_13990 [Burkholderiaceae bacterium]
MPQHNSGHARNWLLAALLALALGAAHLLDGPDDHGSGRAQSAELRDAIKTQAAEARKERAAAQLCLRLHGPQSAHAWDEQGRLTCSNRVGRSSLVVAQGARP